MKYVGYLYGTYIWNIYGTYMENWLVVWTMNFMTFHSVGNGIIIPTDELHHFSEG